MDAGGRGLIADKNIVKWLKETGDENNIQYQMDVSDGGTTDATAIHITREGIPSSTISIATRYIHSPVELLSIDDMKSAVDLVTKAILNTEKYL
jgi:endoglucanase